MKNVLNIFKWIIISIWFVIAVFTTVCLISYNDYKVTVFGKNSLIIVDNDELKPNFNENDFIVTHFKNVEHYNDLFVIQKLN